MHLFLYEGDAPASDVLITQYFYQYASREGLDMSEEPVIKRTKEGKPYFDNIPDICARLLYKGLSIKWYLIGFGSDEDLIRRKIAEQKMESHVILLGKKENPYPYKFQ